jgi:hypothetical protein
MIFPKSSAVAVTLALLGIGGVCSISASAAEITINPAPGALWKIKNGVTGTVNEGLSVEVEKGDVIRFEFGNNHGIVTVDGKGTASPAEKPALVSSCAQAHDGAVLQEIECQGTNSIFNPGAGVGKGGKLPLQVLDGFSEDVFFWCTIHNKMMWGTIKLKQPAQ